MTRRRTGTGPARMGDALAASLVLVVLLGACGSSGKTLRDPPPGATSPAPTTTTTSEPTPVFAVTSSAFTPGGELPAEYTCEAGLSPPLSWAAVPPRTVELALTVSSSGTDPEVYWIVTGLPPTSVGLPAGAVPPEASEGPYRDGGVGWSAPCPPPGETIQLDLTLHALEVPSALDPTSDAAQALDHLNALSATRTLTTVTVTGT